MASPEPTPLEGAQDGAPDLPLVRTAETLREEGEQFTHLVAGVRDYAIFLLDRDGHVLTWNDGAERIKGYTAAEIVGHHFAAFYPKEAVSSGWPAHELRVASATGRFEDEGWRIRRDGSKFWANVVITALRDQTGSVRGFLKIARDLTDRRQAEEKLRSSEERFRLLVEGVHDYAIFLLDPEGCVATWNNGAQRLKGYKASEIVGQHFSRFYPEEARERQWPQEELRRATLAGRFEDEGWRVRKDGTTFWANVVITALRDEHGKLIGFAKVTRDLSERRQNEENARRLLREEAGRKAAEESAREIEFRREQLRVTLASIGDAVIVTDGHGRVSFLNGVAADLAGWPQADAIGRALAEVFRVVDAATHQLMDDPVARILGVAGGGQERGEVLLLSRAGRAIPIDATVSPIGGHGPGVAGFVIVFRDVTEIRRAIETRLLLAAIVESSDDAILALSLDGVVASWNRGAERLYGYRAEEIVGRPIDMLVPGDRREELANFLGSLRRGDPVENFETVRLRKDGTSLHVALTLSPIRGRDGSVVGASTITRDITTHKDEERRKDEFLALLAHELRNPLASLRTGLHVMKLTTGHSDAGESTMAMMERQIQHVVRLVDDLLDISRISRGGLQLQKEPVTLAAVVARALDVCVLTAERREDLVVDLPHQPVWLEADATRLVQAICNLLGNAIRYSSVGQQIRITAERVGDEVLLRVRDEGIGIPADRLDDVFDMFTQVDRSATAQAGLGLGLTIVRRLVTMHGGSVAAHSEGLGKGSEFVVRLPVIAPAAAADEPAAAPAPQATGGHRILVADDNVDSVTALAMMLELLGNEVRTAHDGEQAVHAAAAFRPDVILLDIGMPRLDGYGAARRIRGEPWGRSVLLVALTGWGQEKDKQGSAAAGFDCHLVKPVEPARIVELLAARGRPAPPAM